MPTRPTVNTNTQVITLRVPRTLTDEVRQVATRDCESQATTIRRLLRLALKTDRTQRHDEAV